MNILLIIASILFVYISLANRQEASYLLTSLLPTYLLKANFFTIPTNLFEVFVAIFFVTGLTQSHVRKSWLLFWEHIPRRFRLSLIFFCIAAIISTAISIHPHVSLGILKGWIFIPMLFGFMIGAAIISPEELLSVIKSLVLSGVIVSLLGITQLGTLARLKSIYDVPNSLALFITPLVVIAIWLSVSKRNYFFMMAAIAMIITLLGTQSVGGIIALVASLLIGTTIWIKTSSSRRYFLVSITCLLLMFTVIFWQNGKIPYLISTFHPPYPATSATVRLQLWSISWQLIKQHPLLGIGLGQFEPYYQQILHQRFTNPTQHPIPEFVLRDPHNWLLAFYLNLGPLGLAAFIGSSFYALKSGFKNKTDSVSQALVLGLIAILVYGLTDTIYWKNDLSAQYWLIIFLLLGCRFGYELL